MTNATNNEKTQPKPGFTRRIPRLQLNNHRIGSGAVTALGGLMLALGVPKIGLPTALVGSSYLAATYLMAGALKAGDEDVDNWVKVLDEREKVLIARANEVKEDKAAAKKLIAQIEEKMQSIEAEAQKLNLDLKAKYDRRLAASAAALEEQIREESDAAIKAAQDHSLSRIKYHKSRLIEDNRQLHEEIDSLQTKLEQRDAYLLGEFNHRIESYQTGYSEIQQAIDLQSRTVGEARAEFEAQYLALLDERDRYAEELRKLQAPRRFNFKGMEYDAANDIQQFLQERGIVLACHSVGRNHYGSVPLLYEVVSPHGATAIKPHLEAIQVRLGLPEMPQVEVKDGGLIEIVVQLSRESAPKKKIQIVDPPLTRLENALNDSIHVRIAAPSGSGKSVLLGNLINYLRNEFTSEYQLSDPKVTDPETWGDVKPTHYAFECLGHVFGLAADVMRRVGLAKDAVKAGNPIPKFDPQFHIIDELELVNGLVDCSDSKDFTTKAFKSNIKIMLKAGREHKLKLLFVTQSPLPASLNLNKDDFYNTSSILLGNCISLALDGYTEKGALLADVTREKIAQLKAEYEARLARGDKFTFLFYNPAKPQDIWFGRCPDPGYYSSVATATTILDTPDLGGIAQSHSDQGQVTQAFTPQESQPIALNVGESLEMGQATAAAQPAQGAKVTVEELLEQGTYCPNCKHHTTSYKNRKVRGNGNVSVRCINLDCETKSFSWNVTDATTR